MTTYKRIKRWEERLVRTEVSKIFSLGYDDYLLSLGETECYIPHAKFDESKECLRVIAGRKFPIKLIQDNIYKIIISEDHLPYSSSSRKLQAHNYKSFQMIHTCTRERLA